MVEVEVGEVEVEVASVGDISIFYDFILLYIIQLSIQTLINSISTHRQPGSVC